MHVARLRPVKWHFAAQELVEESAEPVHDAPLGGRKSRELLRRHISRITFRRLRRRELLGEAELQRVIDKFADYGRLARS